MAPDSSGIPKRSQRPVLPSHVAQAHAFAAVPTPGNPLVKTGNSYFVLPTPPAPLRAFTLPQSGEAARGTEGTTSYPTSVASSLRDGPSQPAAETRATQARSADSPKRRYPKATDSTKSYTHSSASISGTAPLQFATAAPFCANGSSPYLSSGSHSARSALSIAEIDCFFVRGSHSSTYSAPLHSPCSQAASECAGLSDYSADQTSNDETSDMWTSDQAERERQRAERLASMKARKEAREELRRRKRLATVGAVDELGAQTKSTWREAIRSKGSMPLNDAPASRESARVRKRAATMDSSVFATPLGQTAVLAASGDAPTPSGPGPPDHINPAPVDTLANGLTSLTLLAPSSEILENPLPKDTTPQPAPGDPPTAPGLTRFDSGKTEVGAPSRPSET